MYGKIKNMVNDKGNSIPNQFIIEQEGRGFLGNFISRKIFQSYDSVIAVKTTWEDKTVIELDEYYWDYSKTTNKYRSIFLRETTAETMAKIKSGEYILTNLN